MMNVSSANDPSRGRWTDPFVAIEVLILICSQVSVFFSSDALRVPAVLVSLGCLVFSALRFVFPLVIGNAFRAALLASVEVAMIIALEMVTSNGAIIVLSIAFILRNAEILAPRRAIATGVTGVAVALLAMVGFAIGRGNDRTATIDTALALLMAIGVTGALASFAASERRALGSLRTAHDELRRYAQRAAESAAERERSRIAAELHDAIGHTLTALNVQLQSAVRLRHDRPAEADALVVSALDLGQGALASVRRTVSALRDDPFERDSLDRVLGKIVARYRADDGPKIDASIDAMSEPPARSTAVARIVEEALVNAVKHARAMQVHVALKPSVFGVTRLEICDDGCGFDVREQGSGHGLRIMRERADRAGIDFALESAPGDGTRVVLQWSAESPA